MSGVSAGRLSLAYRDISELQAPIVKKYGPMVRELDLSNNNFADVSSLREFVQLETLILDNNRISSHTKFPPLPSLKTLWVNRNLINNLATFIDHLVESVPNIKFLSMLNNDACPNFFNGGTLKQYKDYRHYVISRLRNLETLDDSPVTAEEKRDAQRIYGGLETTRTAEGLVTTFAPAAEDEPPNNNNDGFVAKRDEPAGPLSPATATTQGGGGSGKKPATPSKRSEERGGVENVKPGKHNDSLRKERNRPSTSERRQSKSSGGGRQNSRHSAAHEKTKKSSRNRGGTQELPLPDISDLAYGESALAFAKPPLLIPSAEGGSSSSSEDWSSDSEDELIDKALRDELPEIDDLPDAVIDLPDNEDWFHN